MARQIDLFPQNFTVNDPNNQLHYDPKEFIAQKDKIWEMVAEAMVTLINAWVQIFQDFTGIDLTMFLPIDACENLARALATTADNAMADAKNRATAALTAFETLLTGMFGGGITTILNRAAVVLKAPSPAPEGTIQVEFSQDVDIPVTVVGLDYIALGAGAGSTGSAPLGYGVGGQGGKWAAAEGVIATMLAAHGVGTPDSMFASVTIGAGGAGGDYNTLNSLLPGEDGGATTIQIFAVVGAVTTAISPVLSGDGGAASAAIISVGHSRLGGAAHGGNVNAIGALGRDYQLNGITYTGGDSNPGVTGVPGVVPGGGGGGNRAGADVAGNSGADGRAWLRFY